MKARVVWVLVGLFLTGCAHNGFVEYYQDRTGGADMSKAPVIWPTAAPASRHRQQSRAGRAPNAGRRICRFRNFKL